MPEGQKASTGPFSPLAWQLAVLLAMAVLIGGGGVSYALNNLAVQIAALAILAANRTAFFRFWSDAPIALRCLVLGSVALPLLQLVPLPFDMSSALPGRMHLRETMQQIGESSFFPISLAPNRTLVAASALIVPVTVLALGWSLDRKELQTLIRAIVALGTVIAFFGYVQVLQAGRALLLYPENPMPGVLFGTFANRNSAGLFFVAMLCFAAVPPWRDHSRVFQLIRAFITVLLLLAVVLTQSRTAIVLSAIPLGLVVIRALGHVRSERGANRTVRSKGLAIGGIVTAAILAVAVFVSASSSSRIDTIIERFQQSGDARTYLWDDATFSAQNYWPVGAGMGAFDEVFQADESVENLTKKTAGRAHNDYLELAIEGGLFALVLLASWITYCAWSAFQARNAEGRWHAWAASGVLLIIALQSVTDYPLRNLAMLAVAALALLVLMKSRQVQR